MQFCHEILDQVYLNRQQVASLIYDESEEFQRTNCLKKYKACFKKSLIES